MAFWELQCLDGKIDACAVTLAAPTRFPRVCSSTGSSSRLLRPWRQGQDGCEKLPATLEPKTEPGRQRNP